MEIIEKSELNMRQREAVETVEGPLLILAGAGAGKTKTITHRILHLINLGVNPSQILAITFTNKAAGEMRDRISHLLSSGDRVKAPISMSERPFMSTFHALGVHIIKENAHLIGLTRHFTIFDRGDSKKAVKEAMEIAGFNPKEFDPGTVLNAISREKGNAITLEQYRNRARDFYEKMILKIWEIYERTLVKEKSLDFDDLLLKSYFILNKNPEIKEKYNSIWKYIHIDEYQDTNKVQYGITKILAEKSRNICAVGDIDQMIYSWRGADIENIMDFEKDYPEAKIVLLEENYRSTQNILAAANNIIKKNVIRREKNLFTKNQEGEKIQLLISYTEIEEARIIADKARELIENGSNPREISVLYRTNFQSRVLEEAFLKKNIPYQILGTRFFERKEIKDALSFIRASRNRESTADIARIINIPPRGIGKVTLLKIFNNQRDSLNASLHMKVDQFYNLLDRIEEVAEKENPAELIKYIIRETGMESMYRSGKDEDLERLENLRELVSLAIQYDDIEILLTNAALATDQDELEKDKDAVKLMTVHASKGLEFDYVFIAGLEQDLFPHKRLNKEDINKSEEEEERRLFYVALTRARKKIFLSYAQIRTIFGTQKVNTPSEFISDIGDELIESEENEEIRGVKAIFIDF